MIRQIQFRSIELERPIPTIALAECIKLILNKPVEPAELVTAIANLTGRLG